MKLPEEITRADPEPASIPECEAPRDPAAARAHGPPDWLQYIAEPRYAWPILLIFGVALYLVNLGGYPLYTKGEPREAVTVFDIVHGGGVILPQRAGVEIPSKPLLMHWMAAMVSLVAGGVNEFAVRLPSAGLAIAGVIVCYFYVRRLFDNVTALIAALILATTFQYLQAATGARVDMTLTFFMEVAFFEFILMAEGLTRRRMLLYVAIALAVLTKGPIGLILPGLVAVIWLAAEKRWNLLRRMSLVRGAIVVLVLAGGWYLAALIEGGPNFFRKQILAENLLRFAGGGDFHEGHIHPFYYMELALLAGFMPWTILLPIVGVQAARAPRALDPRLKYIIIWFAAVLIFYNLPQSKRGVYLLCMYPALATLVAIYVRQAVVRPEPARACVHWIARLSGLAMLLLGSAGLIALAMLVARPRQFADLLQSGGHSRTRFSTRLDLNCCRGLGAGPRDAARGRRTWRLYDLHPSAYRTNGARDCGRDGFHHRCGQRCRRTGHRQHSLAEGLHRSCHENCGRQSGRLSGRAQLRRRLLQPPHNSDRLAKRSARCPST